MTDLVLGGRGQTPPRSMTDLALGGGGEGQNFLCAFGAAKYLDRMAIATLLGAIEIQLQISPASFIDGHDAERAMHRGIAESWPRSSTQRCVACERSAAPPQTHTRVHTTDRCTARALSL